MAERIAFNLLLNGISSFLAGLLVVFLALKLLRSPSHRERLYLLSLPFLKILWDLARGIPRGSYLYTSINPLALPPKASGLEISAGFNYGPILEIGLLVQDTAKKWHSISGADYLHEWLHRRFSPGAPWWFLAVLTTGSFALLLRRAVLAYRFSRRRRADRRFATGLPTSSLFPLPRPVDLYLSTGFRGTPFTGGVFRPYICFPRETYNRLGEPERRAAIAHELAHIRHFDVALSLAVECLGDIFWFVPGYRLLGRRISRLRELEADRAATAHGASPEHLARALLELSAHAVPSGPIVYSALVKERSLLALRVKTLLEGTTFAGRVSWKRKGVLLFITATVMLCSIGGNHELVVLPPWLENWFHARGWI